LAALADDFNSDTEGVSVITSRLFIAALVPLTFLTGCASLPEDRGLSDVHSLITDRTGYTFRDEHAKSSTAELVGGLLAQPLTAQRAVQVSLINNPRVRLEYARLGISAAEVYNAGRLSNPRLSAGVMSSSESSAANQVTFGLTQSFTDLLLLPSRGRLAKAEFERGKQEAGAAIIDLAADVEAAYYALVGSQQVAAMRANVQKAAQVSAALAQRFYDAGNISILQLTLEQSAASEANIDAIRATADAVAARNTLNRLMGLRAGDERWATPDRLPLPVASEDSFDELINIAWQSRLDLAAKRAEVALLADSLGISRQFRYVGGIAVGIETERETDRSRITGPNLSIELPIFNSGAGNIAQAEAMVDEAEAQLRALALDVGNDVHLAHAQVQATRAVADEFRAALIPQREAVVQHTQARVNYMLIGQFELLRSKQQEFDAYQGYLEALRDYWIARSELGRAVGAQLPSSTHIGSETVGPILLPDDAPAGMHHMHHHTPSHSTEGGQL
jgi:cobalt-zinc-cadmium efflux system outer membrane protein